MSALYTNRDFCLFLRVERKVQIIFFVVMDHTSHTMLTDEAQNPEQFILNEFNEESSGAPTKYWMNLTKIKTCSGHILPQLKS